MERDLIVGLHAIQQALKNPRRRDFCLWMTDDGHKSIASALEGRSDIEQITVKKHDFQQKAKELYRQSNFEYARVGGGLLLSCSAMEVHSPHFLYQSCESQKSLKIVVLDGVTDVHNAGAIVRTSCFYGVDFVVVGAKSSFALTPAFFRVASGGTEHLSVVRADVLPRVVRKMGERGVSIMAFCERGGEECPRGPAPARSALLFGAEDRGISHALLRQCEKRVFLPCEGKIASLNVSVAAAVAMERLFSGNA